jgi:hypothetical protein
MTADEEGWIEGMSDFHTAFDDAWSRMFAMILGTALPDTKVKDKFLEFVKDWSMNVDGNLSANESDIIELFPDFLDTLVAEE